MCVSQNPLERLERMSYRDQMPDTLRNEPHKVSWILPTESATEFYAARINRATAAKNQADPAKLRELGIHPDRAELTLEQRIARIEKALGIV